MSTRARSLVPQSVRSERARFRLLAALLATAAAPALASEAPLTAPAAATSGPAPPAVATAAAADGLTVRDAWVRQPPPGADSVAAYLTLGNTSRHEVTVVGFDSPAAEAAMLHETVIESGESRMRARASLVLAAGQTVVLKPGGLHVMLHGLKQPLAAGQRIPLVVRLASGGTITVSALVRPIGSE